MKALSFFEAFEDGNIFSFIGNGSDDAGAIQYHRVLSQTFYPKQIPVMFEGIGFQIRIYREAPSTASKDVLLLSIESDYYEYEFPYPKNWNDFLQYVTASGNAAFWTSWAIERMKGGFLTQKEPDHGNGCTLNQATCKRGSGCSWPHCEY